MTTRREERLDVRRAVSGQDSAYTYVAGVSRPQARWPSSHQPHLLPFTSVEASLSAGR